MKHETLIRVDARPDDAEQPVGRDTRPKDAASIIGQSPAMTDVMLRIRRIATTNATALIGGETGTGKELAARAIHYLGARRNEAFICVNCGALPDSLIENELFGHERGAYTGACGTAMGLVADAENGTLFLDEVEEMSPHAQASLLRFLQDHTYRPIGSRRVFRANVRVIAASNTSLVQLVREGKFRQDLLFRLRLMVVDMPPLRDRTGDIPLLTRHFLIQLIGQYGGDPRRVPPGVMNLLCRYRWPGNVRELENLLHRAFLLSDGPELVVDPAEFRPDVEGAPAYSPAAHELANFAEAKAFALAQFERVYVSQALRECHGNVSAAARRVGKERRAFGKLLKKYGIGHWKAPELDFDEP